ncbi:MAG: hypothetical protein ACAH11_04305 [Sphingomonas sp.]
MQLPMIAALLLAPPADSNLCASLKQSIARAPYGFTELPADLFAEPFAGEYFDCSVIDSSKYDAEAPRHRDLVCETPMRVRPAGVDPKDSPEVALRGEVAECLGRPADFTAFLFDTPEARVEVTGSFVISTSRIGPAPPPTRATVLVIHAKP